MIILKTKTNQHVLRYYSRYVVWLAIVQVCQKKDNLPALPLSNLR